MYFLQFKANIYSSLEHSQKLESCIKNNIFFSIHSVVQDKYYHFFDIYYISLFLYKLDFIYDKIN